MGFVPGKRFRRDKMECWRGRYEKRGAGKSLDLTVTLFIGNHIGAIVGTPSMYLIAMFALGL